MSAVEEWGKFFRKNANLLSQVADANNKRARTDILWLARKLVWTVWVKGVGFDVRKRLALGSERRWLAYRFMVLWARSV